MNAFDSHAGISAKIKRHSAPFLSNFIAGLLDFTPNDYDMLQVALTLKDVNNSLCSFHLHTVTEIDKSQHFLFKFGLETPTFFKFDFTTSLSRLLPNVDRKLVRLGFLRRGVSEDNDMSSKEFQSIYNNTKMR